MFRRSVWYRIGRGVLFYTTLQTNSAHLFKYRVTKLDISFLKYFFRETKFIQTNLSSRPPKPTVAVPSHFDRKFVVLSDVKYWYVVAQPSSDGTTGTRNLIFG